MPSRLVPSAERSCVETDAVPIVGVAVASVVVVMVVVVGVAVVVVLVPEVVVVGLLVVELPVVEVLVVPVERALFPFKTLQFTSVGQVSEYCMTPWASRQR
jgi:hypothetical protein